MNKYNKEHYSDPTPHDAMKNIARKSGPRPWHRFILSFSVSQ